jgi:YfiH family protein
MARFDLLEPAMWTGATGIRAAFSLRNVQWNTERAISGLNLSVSTNDDRDVVLQNRELFYESLGLSEQDVARGRQVHGNTVHIVTEGGIHADGDGFVTNTPGVAVSVMVADCAAILLADRRAGVVGALHAGWRGTVAGIVASGIQAMTLLGAHPSDIEAYIGPCISKACFELGEEVASQFPDQYVDRTGTKPHADIRHWLKDQLLAENIASKHIEIDTSCTFGDEDRYYSYRRQGDASGRMMALVWMPT